MSAMKAFWHSELIIERCCSIEASHPFFEVLFILRNEITARLESPARLVALFGYAVKKKT